ncbi:MAG: Rieske 2Fe-2S domain-containing protein [Chitinophagaceae bacterium]
MPKNYSTNVDILRYPHPVLQSKKLKKIPQQITLLDKKYVLYRVEKGEPVALPDVRPHRGAVLSKGKVNAAGELVCAYHAWRIKSDGNVTCPSVPKRSCKISLLRTWEKYGFIWIANAEVNDESFPEFALPDYELIGSFSSSFKAPLKVVLDNFGEIEHAFQVHSFIGPSRKAPAITNFSVDIQDDKTFGYFSCKYRPLPFFMRCFFGIKKDDLYHNDWVFKFKPLHGSYFNYWTDSTGEQKGPVSFIVTFFLVPKTDNEVRVQTFVQIQINNKLLKFIAPILKVSTMLITQFEILADGDIAKFSPTDTQDGSNWKLTFLDKQIMANRKRMETLYFARENETVAEY